MGDTIVGIDRHDVIIPIIVWSIILVYYFYQLWRRSQYKNISFHDVSKEGFMHYTSYFYQMRGGWVRRNHLTGQSAANSTRDYLRVLLFFCGNAGSVGMILAGYTASTYSEDATPRQYYLSIKLGVASLILLVIFFLFLYAIRYGTHFHFLMNVMEANNGVPMNLRVIELVFHRSHFYYAAGLRMYFLLLPLFAWTVSSWALLAMCPIYLWVVEDYENLSFLEPELAIMYKNFSTHQAQWQSERLADAAEKGSGTGPTPAGAAATTANAMVTAKTPDEVSSGLGVAGIQLQSTGGKKE